VRSRRRPEKLAYFVDRCLGGKTVPEILRAAGKKVEPHDKHFPETALDEDWLPIVGRKKWVVLTEDSRIRYVHGQAIERAKIRVFILMSKKLNGQQMAAAFLKAINRIEKMARKNQGPFIAKVYKDGRVVMSEVPYAKEQKTTLFLICWLKS